MKVSMIFGSDKNGAIGYQNKLPYKNKHDMEVFKSYTMNKVVIMGWNTWQSLNGFPLKNRINIVISKIPETIRHYDINPDTTLDFFTSLEEALVYFNHVPEVFIIGGAKLFQYALDKNLVDEIIHNEIDIECENVDTFFHVPRNFIPTFVHSTHAYEGEEVIKHRLSKYRRARVNK